MNNEEIRIKVAKAMGWKGVSPDYLTGYAPWRPTPYSERIMQDLDSIPLDPLPDYPNNLNACAEFEVTLTDEEWNIYSAQMIYLTLWDRATDTVKRIFQATARQRCLAYLKTKGLTP